MDHPNDAALAAAIEAHATVASDVAPSTIDAFAAATELARNFPHRTVEEIHEQIRQHFRANGLFWADK